MCALWEYSLCGLDLNTFTVCVVTVLSSDVMEYNMIVQVVDRMAL